MAKPSNRKNGRSCGNSMFTGMLIGLTVGAVLAVGVALWATGLNPFKSPTKTAPDQPPGTPEAAPSFDFYKVLPSDSPGDVSPTVTPTAPTPRYYLQAGAFQNPNDADNLKAQLAMLGIEAAIQTGEVAGKGVFHRVRVGPFSAMDEADRTRSLLAQNKIPATLVKEVPTQ